MEINGVTIQMLPAASGDCIYLEFPDSDFRMLIDGGYAKTYQKYLKKFLLKLAAEGKRLNLIVVTHIDDDHISGIRALLKENGDSRNPNSLLGISVKNRKKFFENNNIPVYDRAALLNAHCKSDGITVCAQG